MPNIIKHIGLKSFCSKSRMCNPIKNRIGKHLFEKLWQCDLLLVKNNYQII